MIIQLDREAKIELLKAVKTGFLDVSKIPALFNELQGGNVFIELMKELDKEENKNTDS